MDAIWAALGQPTVVVPGTAAADTILPQLARSRDAHPVAGVLTSMPGVGVRTAARILLEVGDGSTFPTAAHLAAHAGLAPVTHRSGTSIRGEHPARSGNKHLKRAFFLSAFAALHADPTSRTYDDRKRAEGKKHNAALICLATPQRRPARHAQEPDHLTNPDYPPPLDDRHRDTPRSIANGSLLNRAAVNVIPRSSRSPSSLATPCVAVVSTWVMCLRIQHDRIDAPRINSGHHRVLQHTDVREEELLVETGGRRG